MTRDCFYRRFGATRHFTPIDLNIFPNQYLIRVIYSGNVADEASAIIPSALPTCNINFIFDIEIEHNSFA